MELTFQGQKSETYCFFLQSLWVKKKKNKHYTYSDIYIPIYPTHKLQYIPIYIIDHKWHLGHTYVGK